MKDFYSNLAGNLLAKLPKPPNWYIINFVSGYYRKLTLFENFKLVPAAEDALFKLLKNVEVTKSAGIDQISGTFLKDGARILTKPISELRHLSVTLWSLPDACKIKKIKPLFKKDSRTDPTNFKLISMLPLLLKTFERIVLGQTNNLLSLNKILYDYQYGFRKKHSTDTFFTFFFKWQRFKRLWDGLLTAMILIDLRKAFDTIDEPWHTFKEIEYYRFFRWYH